MSEQPDEKNDDSHADPEGVDGHAEAAVDDLQEARADSFQGSGHTEGMALTLDLQDAEPDTFEKSGEELTESTNEPSEPETD